MPLTIRTSSRTWPSSIAHLVFQPARPAMDAFGRYTPAARDRVPMQGGRWEITLGRLPGTAAAVDKVRTRWSRHTKQIIQSRTIRTAGVVFPTFPIMAIPTRDFLCTTPSDIKDKPAGSRWLERAQVHRNG